MAKKAQFAQKVRIGPTWVFVTAITFMVATVANTLAEQCMSDDDCQANACCSGSGYCRPCPEVLAPPAIRQLQKRLKIPQTGVLDLRTKRAIGVFQERQGLPKTGIIDRPTHERLFK
jgi:hypothetical protein